MNFAHINAICTFVVWAVMNSNPHFEEITQNKCLKWVKEHICTQTILEGTT